VRVNVELRTDREYEDSLMEVMIGIRSRQIFGQGKVQLRDTKGNLVFRDNNGKYVSGDGAKGEPVMVNAWQQGLAKLITTAVSAAEVSSVLFFVPNPILKEKEGGGDIKDYKLHSAKGKKTFWRVLMTLFDQDQKRQPALKKTLPYGSFYNPRPGQANATMNVTTSFGTKLNIIPVAAGVRQSLDKAQAEVSGRIGGGEDVHIAEDVICRLDPEIFAHPAVISLRNFSSMAAENPERFLSYANLARELADLAAKNGELEKFIRSTRQKAREHMNEGEIRDEDIDDNGIRHILSSLNVSFKDNEAFLKDDAQGKRFHRLAVRIRIEKLLTDQELVESLQQAMITLDLSMRLEGLLRKLKVPVTTAKQFVLAFRPFVSLVERVFIGLSTIAFRHKVGSIWSKMYFLGYDKHQILPWYWRGLAKLIRVLLIPESRRGQGYDHVLIAQALKLDRDLREVALIPAGLRRSMLHDIYLRPRDGREQAQEDGMLEFALSRIGN